MCFKWVLPVTQVSKIRGEMRKTSKNFGDLQVTLTVKTEREANLGTGRKSMSLWL